MILKLLFEHIVTIISDNTVWNSKNYLFNTSVLLLIHSRLKLNNAVFSEKDESKITIINVGNLPFC